MLKNINGERWMTGTSEGSLYRVVLWDDNSGFTLGVQVKKGVNEEMGVMRVLLYARIQFHDMEDGSEVDFNFSEASKIVGGSEWKIASAKHISSVFAACTVDYKDKDALAEASKGLTEVFVNGVSGLSKKNYMARLQDEDLTAMVMDKFKEELAKGEVPKIKSAEEIDAEIEELFNQVDKTDAFDFTKMLGKKKED